MLKALIGLAAALFILATASVLRADTTPSPEFDPVAAAPFIEYAKKYIKTFDRPTLLFSWAGSKQASGPTSAADGFGYQYFNYFSKVYWQSYGVASFASNMGAGLYFATDPFSSARWGRGSNWRLLEILVPARMSYLNLTDDIAPAGDVVNQVLESNQCPKIQTLTDLFRNRSVARSCRVFVHKFLPRCFRSRRLDIRSLRRPSRNVGWIISRRLYGLIRAEYPQTVLSFILRRPQIKQTNVCSLRARWISAFL